MVCSFHVVSFSGFAVLALQNAFESVPSSLIFLGRIWRGLASLNVCYNSPVKHFSPKELFFVEFLIIKLTFMLAIDLFRLSISSWFSHANLHISRNFPFHLDHSICLHPIYILKCRLSDITQITDGRTLNK